MSSKIKHRITSPLKKKARRGFCGYPLATIAFYGPNDRWASKVVVAIFSDDDRDPLALERWFSEDEDIRTDTVAGQQILAFIQRHQVKSVTMTDRIIGCPHEASGGTAPLCRSFLCGRFANRCLLGREVLLCLPLLRCSGGLSCFSRLLCGCTSSIRLRDSLATYRTELPLPRSGFPAGVSECCRRADFV